MQITTLIPAYKTTYITDLLNCLRLQTVRPDRIVVSDDSPGGRFRETMESEPYRALRAGLEIEFIEGPRNGAYENVKHLVRHAGQADIAHILLDDDLVYPEFYERHRVAHASADFSCVVSRRWSCSETGLPTMGQRVPAVVAQSPNRMNSLSGEMVILTSVGGCCNWFGEFSNATFRADCLELLLEPQLAGVSYAGLWDLGAFVAASLRRPLCHIQDHLGAFRTSPNQNSADPNNPFMKGALLGLAALAVAGRRLGKLAEAQALAAYAEIASAQHARYSQQPDMADFNAVLPRMAAGEPGAEQRFVELWHPWLAGHGF